MVSPLSVWWTYQVIRGLWLQPVLAVNTDLSCVWYSHLLNANVPCLLMWRPQRAQIQAMFHSVNEHHSILHTSTHHHVPHFNMRITLTKALYNLHGNMPLSSSSSHCTTSTETFHCHHHHHQHHHHKLCSATITERRKTVGALQCQCK